MKTIATQITLFMRQKPSRRNVWLLVRFLLVLTGMIVVYSVAFHYLMLRYENHDHSWVTGFYWTLTVMSTLGFGDITFASDAGRAFSILVLLSGVVFMLVLLPFTIIQFFYAPWIEAQNALRAPDKLDAGTSNHVVLTHLSTLSREVVRRCRQYGYEVYVLVADRADALRLDDEGFRVMVGDLNDPDTYRRCRLPAAAMLLATGEDETNTKAVFVAHEALEDADGERAAVHEPYRVSGGGGGTLLVATARHARSAPILTLAGADHVLKLGEVVGESLARRTVGGDAVSHVVDTLGELEVAEANAMRTPLVGKSIADNRLGDYGVVVLGVWERGHFELARPDTMIGENAILVLGGTREQLEQYDEGFAIYNVSGEPVVLIGGGRVGLAAARALTDRGIAWKMIERDPARVPPGTPEADYFIGDAADADVLERAGIDDAPAVLITPPDDALNVYLTLLLRDRRPDIQIISRAELERNVRTLHRAGADFVMSTASLGAGRVMNLLRRGSLVPLAEGLNIMRMQVPPALAGRKLVDTTVRQDTGATIIATVKDGRMTVNPDPHQPLPEACEILLLGDRSTEERFAATYGPATAKR